MRRITSNTRYDEKITFDRAGTSANSNSIEYRLKKALDIWEKNKSNNIRQRQPFSCSPRSCTLFFSFSAVALLVSIVIIHLHSNAIFRFLSFFLIWSFAYLAHYLCESLFSKMIRCHICKHRTNKTKQSWSLTTYACVPLESTHYYHHHSKDHDVRPCWRWQWGLFCLSFENGIDVSTTLTRLGNAENDTIQTRPFHSITNAVDLLSHRCS